MATAHLEWKDTRESRGDGGRDIVESYLVLNATSRQDAFLATGLPGGNATFEGDTMLRVRQRDMAQEGPTTYRATITYKKVSFEANESPLDKPWVVEWSRRVIDAPAEFDARGFPIVNTAYQFFDPPPPRSVTIQVLTITRNESFYDWGFYNTFINTTNAAPFVLARTRFEIADCLCEDIGPAGPFEADAEYIPIRYQFALWKDNRTNGGQPWDYHIPNLGDSGFFDKGGTKTLGAFVSGAGAEPTGPIPLDNTGKPRDATIKIMNGQKPESPVAATAPASMPPGFAFSYSPYSTDSFPRLLYRKYPRSDFTQLLT